MKRLGRVGDTIVEVLIAIGVVNLVLAGAFSISNRSLTGIRVAQEHAEAAKIASDQIERLNAKFQEPQNKGIFIQRNPWCVQLRPGPSNDLQLRQAVRGGRPAVECQVPNGIIYTIENTRTQVSGTNEYQFAIRVYWDSATGRGQDQVIYHYQLNCDVGSSGTACD